MSSQYELDDIIDLTNSQAYTNHITPRSVFSNSVICIDSDDSFSLSPVINRISKKSKESKDQKSGSQHPQKSIDRPERRGLKESKIRFGECPICWDELGTKPLASTICGHVYCIECIKISLSAEKRCPICRTILKGKLAYHPLYLAR